MSILKNIKEQGAYNKKSQFLTPLFSTPYSPQTVIFNSLSFGFFFGGDLSINLEKELIKIILSLSNLTFSIDNDLALLNYLLNACLFYSHYSYIFHFKNIVLYSILKTHLNLHFFFIPFFYRSISSSNFLRKRVLFL